MHLFFVKYFSVVPDVDLQFSVPSDAYVGCAPVVADIDLFGRSADGY